MRDESVTTETHIPRVWTRADLEELPDDGNRYEVLDGKLYVTPLESPDHQRLAIELCAVLHRYVEPSGFAHLVGPGNVPFGGNELLPDVHVIPGRPQRHVTWEELPAPLLVAEVLSDITRRRDLAKKPLAYRQGAGAPTYWVVDYERREVHVWSAGVDGEVQRDWLVWHPTGAAEPLTIDLPSFFRDALGA